MATAKTSGVILELSDEEAKYLSGLLISATDWDQEELASEIRGAIAEAIGDDYTIFKFDSESQSFVSEK